MARKARRKRKPPVSLSDEQLLALLETAKRHRERDHIMMLVTYWHGLRASETINLRESDFDLNEGTVHIVRGKGSEGGLHDLQTFPENPLLDEKAAITAWLANRAQFGVKGGAKPKKSRQSTEIVSFLPSDRLFPIGRQRFWAIVHAYALEAGIPRRKCKTHMLKHTIAKHLVRAGHPLNEIQEWMGWSTIETMNWYTRADEEELGHRIGNTIRSKVGLRQVRQESLFR